MTDRAPQMPPTRRRPIPGMSHAPAAPPPPSTIGNEEAPSPNGSSELRESTEAARAPEASPAPASRNRRRPASRPVTNARRKGNGDDAVGDDPVRPRRPAADYTTTRLVNFRIPVDLHDRYRQLVREADEQHPRLRRPSLTELVIALLEEGPHTATDVAELIRRKRAAEHAGEAEA